MTDAVSEPTFLLSELRYTIGQIHVQLGSIEPAALEPTGKGSRGAEQILGDLVTREAKCQAQYARLLGMQTPQPEQTGGDKEAEFDKARNQTIGMLDQVEGDWSPELVDAVRQQVADDRKCATAIAELRGKAFDEDQRPDLRRPLTEQGSPN